MRNAGKRRRWKTSGTLINGPEITDMTLFIKTSASTGAISSIRQRKIPTFPLIGWKKCRRPLKRSKKKLCKGNGRLRRKKPARKNLRTGSLNKRISFWIWRNTDKAAWPLPLASVSAPIRHSFFALQNFLLKISKETIVAQFYITQNYIAVFHLSIKHEDLSKLMCLSVMLLFQNTHNGICYFLRIAFLIIPAKRNTNCPFRISYWHCNCLNHMGNLCINGITCRARRYANSL